MKTKMLIVRDTYNATETFGKLYINGVFICDTLELPWRNNERSVSCIPKGKYQVVHRQSAKYKNHLHIIDVPGRSLILIHPGNSAKDTNGCILPGMIRSANSLLNSKIAMDEIMKLTFKKTDIEIEVQ
jgi:hypothetical protein